MEEGEAFGCEVQCLAGHHTLRIYPGDDFYEEIAERGFLTYCRPCLVKQKCPECDNDDCLICDSCPADMVFKTISCVNCINAKKDYDPEYWYCDNCLKQKEVQAEKQKRALPQKERRVGQLFMKKLRLERDVQRDQQLDTHKIMPCLDSCITHGHYTQALYYLNFLMDWAQRQKNDTRPAEIEALQQELDAECTHL